MPPTLPINQVSGTRARFGNWATPDPNGWSLWALVLLVWLAFFGPLELKALDLPPNSNIRALIKTDTYEKQLAGFRTQLEVARHFRQEKRLTDASTNLVALLESSAPVELKREALLELALATEDSGDLPRAQQVLTQYTQRYPDDPTVPEILLRQGLLYRSTGANSMALSKFYAVLTAALRLKADRLGHYQQLVLQAQTQIAETYYLQGKFASAAEFFGRLLKLESPALNQEHILYKLVRSLDFEKRDSEIVSQGEAFLSKYPQASAGPEVEFLTAGALKRLGRDREAAQHVFLLLQRQQTNAAAQPADWIYWQQRAGNEIANQMYQGGDYANALAIYLRLAQLDSAPAWRWPVLYQIGLVYERLAQPQKSSESYDQLLSGANRASLTNGLSPSLQMVLDMARWRKDYLAWQTRAEQSNAQLHIEKP